MKSTLNLKNLFKKRSGSEIFFTVFLKNQRAKGENRKNPNPELFFYQKATLRFRSDNFLVFGFGFDFDFFNN